MRHGRERCVGRVFSILVRTIFDVATGSDRSRSGAVGFWYILCEPLHVHVDTRTGD